MAWTLGRVTLPTPRSIRRFQPRVITDVEGPGGASHPAFQSRGAVEYHVTGKKGGSDMDAFLASFEKEGARIGSVYVTDDGGRLKEGYYELRAPEVMWPPGNGPKPWDVFLASSPSPFIHRQAEDDNIAGADTADVEAEEEKKVVYTPTAIDVVVLQPRTVAGAENINLPAGDWRAILHCRSVATFSQKFRWRTTDAAGAALITGAQKTNTKAGEWEEIDLGVITVAQANDKANWYEVLVQGVAGALNDVWLDRLRLVPA